MSKIIAGNASTACAKYPPSIFVGELLSLTCPDVSFEVYEREMRHGAKDLAEGDGRSGHPRFQPQNLERNVTLLSQFEEIAKKKGVSPAQLALAWLMAQGKDIIPIPSNKTRAHLEENVRAIEIMLTKEDLDRLEAIFRPEAVAGPRSRDMHRVNI